MVGDIAQLIEVIRGLSATDGANSNVVLVMIVYAVKDILIKGSIITLVSLFIYNKYISNNKEK